MKLIHFLANPKRTSGNLFLFIARLMIKADIPVGLICRTRTVSMNKDYQMDCSDEALKSGRSRRANTAFGVFPTIQPANSEEAWPSGCINFIVSRLDSELLEDEED